MAFKTEKAAGIIATQFRLSCNRNKRKYSEVKVISVIANIALAFFRKGGITENLRPTLSNKEKTKKRSKNNNTRKQNKQKITDEQNTIRSGVYFFLFDKFHLFRIP